MVDFKSTWIDGPALCSVLIAGNLLTYKQDHSMSVNFRQPNERAADTKTIN